MANETRYTQPATITDLACGYRLRVVPWDRRSYHLLKPNGSNFGRYLSERAALAKFAEIRSALCAEAA
jgi:hypothetical protein